MRCGLDAAAYPPGAVVDQDLLTVGGRTSFAVLAVLVVLAGACRGNATEAAPPAPGPTATPTPSPTPEEPEAIAPLTGEPTDDEDVIARPVVAVKIENTAAARPQSGIEDADIVFEELVEGGITRFAAIFQSRVPEVVGPIRSGRPEDAEIMPAFEPFLFMSGLRAEVKAMLNAAGIPWIREDGTVMWRDGSRRSPHNVYAEGDDLFEYAEDNGVPPATAVRWTFTEEPPAGGTPEESLTVAMSSHVRTGWEWDEAAGVYRRLQDGQPFTVTGSGRVGAANVLILEMTVGTKGCCDSAGNPYPYTHVLGSGEAVVLRDGTRWEGTWMKTSPSSHYQVTVAGRPFAFKPGPTWVLFAPSGSLP